VTSEIIALGVAVLTGAALLTYGTRRWAILRGQLDIPNARSSHSVATPRGGGLAIVLTATAGFVVLNRLGSLPTPVLLGLLAGLAVAFIGFIDDRRPISSALRLVIHFCAAFGAVALLGGVPPIQMQGVLWSLGPAGSALAAVGIVWSINLYNFMDGIDGIAAAEAIFVLGTVGLLSSLTGAGSGLVEPEFVLATACLGFLVWNWPPAKIFMGDVGSGYLGYSIAALAIASAGSPVGLLTWLTLGGLFFVDATVTLLRRAMRGESLLQAHRSHAYQWMARRWNSHRRTTISVLSINLLWLLPMAWLEVSHPRHAAWLTVLALAPVAALALWAGAGRKEGDAT